MLGGRGRGADEVLRVPPFTPGEVESLSPEAPPRQGDLNPLRRVVAVVPEGEVEVASHGRFGGRPFALGARVCFGGRGEGGGRVGEVTPLA